MSIFSKIKNGLRKTKELFSKRIEIVLNSFTKIDEELFESLEESMISADIGATTAIEICEILRKKIKELGITDPKEIYGLIKDIISEMLGDDNEINVGDNLSIILVIGVNGAGKTTTIGKLSAQLKTQGKTVLVAAADTFRAAAIGQLNVWTDRAGVDIIKRDEGSDPASVIYDALAQAKSKKYDVLICDTAGRLHNKKNLMDELAKINRIIDKGCEDVSHTRETLLVLDATTGQNAVNQARLFSETADITGIVLTKLDGTAKGGIVIPIKNELQIPIKLIGVGEKIDDLQPFEKDDFIRAIFEIDDEPSEVIAEVKEELAEEDVKEIEKIIEETTDLPIDEIAEESTEIEEPIEKKKKAWFFKKR